MENHRKLTRRRQRRRIGSWFVATFGAVYPIAIGVDRIGGQAKTYMDSISGVFGLTTADFAAIAFFGFIFGLIIRRTAGNPTFALAVEPVLDVLRQHAFVDEYAQSDPEHHHRATLFRHCPRKFWIWPFRKWYSPWGASFRGPWAGWLIPISRSGHTTKHSDTTFLAPDDADNAEGVAGMIWASKQDVRPIRLVLDGPDDAQKYAEETNVSTDYVLKQLEEEKPLPLSLSGFPVFRGGQIWGVVVLDSRRTDGIKPPDQNFRAIRITQSLLDKYVSRYT